MVDVRQLDAEAVKAVLALEESHFVDLKAKEIAPARLSKTISAFANTSGGEIYVGIEEVEGAEGPERKWAGFNDQEDANAFLQVLETLNPLGTNYHAEFLGGGGAGWILHLSIFKTQEIVFSTEGRAFVRRGAQSLPVATDEALDRLKFEKGIRSFEDQLVDLDVAEVGNSATIIDFLISASIDTEPEQWLAKQRLVNEKRPSVAAVLLYHDNPQAILPKRSAIKLLRYQTKNEAERDYLVFDPVTIEGPVYDLIYSAVDKAKEIIESVEKVTPEGMVPVSYPHEALHEIVTNAVLHRDYNVAADVQIRIFDNRVEIESPGRLPGHVTVQNIRKTQFARNPKLVRLVNKFDNPPNKDVGEGVNTAFEAMNKLRLKKPEFVEGDGSVIVTLKHESLGSPEQLVMDYLSQQDEITNSLGREITGIKSENTMKQVFYRLRESGQLEQTPKVVGKKPSWRKVQKP